MPFFTYGQKEIAHLKAKDPVLGAYIEQRGMIYRSVNPDLFSALVSSIISQQITGKAAQTVFQRLKDLAGEIKPENIVKHTIEELQKCGMSFRKASYIRDLSEKVATKTFDLESIRALNDEELIEKLIKLKGIGRWTAEMLMIFSLERSDILSYNDLAIFRGLQMLYGLADISKEEFAKIKERYSPYASIASFYLWDLANANNQ